MSKRDEVYEEAKRRLLDHTAEMFDLMVQSRARDFESPIEELMMFAMESLMWDSELYEWHQQVNAGDYRVDFLITYREPEQKKAYPVSVAVECDGHDFHEKTKEQAQRDKKRDRDLLALGLHTIRFTGSEIWADPFKCVQEAMQLVAQLYYKAVLGPEAFKDE